MSDDPIIVLIVVGATLDAERFDRPLGYRLREAILGWRDEQQADIAVDPVVCTDLWYLNDESLHRLPVVAIGDPEVNAATAYLASRLPTAFVIDDTLRVHLDPDFVEPRACLWGASPTATVSAVDLFTERYLEELVLSAVGG